MIQNLDINKKFTIVKTLKSKSAYLITQNRQYGVLKCEGLLFGRKYEYSDDGSYRTSPVTGRRVQRARSLAYDGTQTRSVKKTVKIAAMIIAHVTGEDELADTKIFSGPDSNRIANKIPDMKDFNLRYEYVWYLIPCYKNLTDFGSNTNITPAIRYML